MPIDLFILWRAPSPDNSYRASNEEYVQYSFQTASYIRGRTVSYVEAPLLPARTVGNVLFEAHPVVSVADSPRLELNGSLWEPKYNRFL